MELIVPEHIILQQEHQKIQSEWNELITNIGNINNFNSLIDAVNSLTKNNQYKDFVKWKDIDNNTTIKSNEYYYKIYQTDYRTGTYTNEIRNKLADIYRNEYGIVWNIATIEQGNVLYQLEQREQLEICNIDTIRFEDILLSWSYTLENLENRLYFPYILSQLHRNELYKNISYIKILRNCVNKHKDYAYTPDKQHIILLDDSDFFISLLDKEYKRINIKRSAYDIETTSGMLSFTPLEQDRIEKCNSMTNKWFFVDYEINPKYQNMKLKSMMEQMLDDNAYILSTHQLTNKEIYHKSKYEHDQWGTESITTGF